MAMRSAGLRLLAALVTAVAAAGWLGIDLPLGVDPAARPAREAAGDLVHQNTPWSRYPAPEGTCRGDSNVGDSRQQQLFAMRCLVDWARRERGVAALRADEALASSAALKASAIARCNDFSHTPCGARFAATFEAVGWRRPAGENIAWAAAGARAPRTLLDGWLHSRGHRENLFRSTWRAQGFAFVQVDEFTGQGPAAIWVHQFGG